MKAFVIAILLLACPQLLLAHGFDAAQFAWFEKASEADLNLLFAWTVADLPASFHETTPIRVIPRDRAEPRNVSFAYRYAPALAKRFPELASRKVTPDSWVVVNDYSGKEKPLVRVYPAEYFNRRFVEERLAEPAVLKSQEAR